MTHTKRLAWIKQRAERCASVHGYRCTCCPFALELVAEVERLQAIVDKLPVDANGAPVVPRIQDVWHPDEPRSGVLMDEEEVEFDRTGAGDWHYRKVGECYGTPEAAKAAEK